MDVCPEGHRTHTDYIYTPGGLTAIFKRTLVSETLYYVTTDHMGSIRAITDAEGELQAEYRYEPWGGRVLIAGDNTLTDRGYTGHEHLEPLGLINMNGRIYDPTLARFLSPDPYVQAPDFTQGFNRYSYCLNNPFKYTDPSGEEIVTAIVVIAGAIIGAYLGGVASNSGELNPVQWNWKVPETYLMMLGGAVIGAAAGYGIMVPGTLSLSIGVNITTPWLSAGIGVTDIVATGSMADWKFQWSTSAGGGGEMPLKREEKDKVKSNKNIKNIVRESYNSINNQYYIPQEILTYNEAKDFVIRWSQDLDVETMVYYTNKGWFFEKTEGWYEDSYVKNHKSGAFPYSLSGNEVHPTNNAKSWANLLWIGHPHPKSNPPSNGDRLFSSKIKRPIYTWGWNGNDYIAIGKTYLKVWMYLKYGHNANTYE